MLAVMTMSIIIIATDEIFHILKEQSRYTLHDFDIDSMGLFDESVSIVIPFENTAYSSLTRPTLPSLSGYKTMKNKSAQ